MELYRLMEKIARGHRLSENEISELRFAFRALEEVKDAAKGWLSPGSSQPNVDTITARRADLITPPGNPYMVYWFDADIPDMFVIPNNDWTPLDLTDSRLTIFQDNPCVVRMDGTKIYPNFPGSYIAFQGRVLFNTDATGERHVGIAFYDSGDVLIERRMLSAMDSIGAGSGTPVQLANFRPAQSPLSTDPDQYFQIEVWQDSGSNLEVGGIDLILTLAYK